MYYEKRKEGYLQYLLPLEPEQSGMSVYNTRLLNDKAPGLLMEILQ